MRVANSLMRMVLIGEGAIAGDSSPQTSQPNQDNMIQTLPGHATHPAFGMRICIGRPEGRGRFIEGASWELDLGITINEQASFSRFFAPLHDGFLDERLASFLSGPAGADSYQLAVETGALSRGC